MDNKSELQIAALAICDASVALNNGRAMMAVAMARNLDLPLVATVNGKAIPFALRDYAFKPQTPDGKADNKLRNAQFAAIMAQGFGESETPSEVSDAVKTAFNATFGAALWMEANGGAIMLDIGEPIPEGFDGITLADCQFHNVPLAYAFDVFDKDGAATETGKALIERVTAMFSPDKGPEMSQDEAIDLLYSKRVDAVGGTTNRRYGLKTVTVTDLLAAWKHAAIRDGLLQGGPKRSGRTNQPIAPSDVIKGFETFLANIQGKDGESKVALEETVIASLKALRGKIDATIKAIA